MEPIICERDGYTLHFWPLGEMTEVHLELKRWSKSVYKRLRQDVVELAASIGGPIVTSEPSSPCSQKLITYLGFQKAGYRLWRIT